MDEIHQDIACQRCGCVCDDLIVAVDNNRAVEIKNACSLAQDWWQKVQHRVAPTAQVNGQDVPAPEAISRAAGILKQSRAPLVCTTDTCGVNSQRAAIALAEKLGGTFDPLSSTLHQASTLAFQAVGQSGATLGEIRNRADLIVFWRSDPVVTHPRFLERFVDAPGFFAPMGRADRRVIVVDESATATAELADELVELPVGEEMSSLAALRALIADAKTSKQTSPDVVRLAEAMKNCRYGAICVGAGIAEQPNASLVIESLLELVRELNAHTRFVAQVMGGPSVSEVLTWQTGFPMAVNFALGYPRYGPQEFSAESLLESNDVDCLLVVGDTENLSFSEPAEKTLQKIPRIILGNDSPSEKGAEIFVATAVDGIHRESTTFRMDDVALPLRAVLDSSLPTQAEVLHRISEAI